MVPRVAPKVSVVMPVKNAGETLAPAVKSVLMQTMRDFELIIVDDGGGGMCRLKLSVPRDKRIKIISLPPTGIVGALNAGIAIAAAPYIARMDADDVCSPRRLELQLAHMENNPDCALLGSRVRKFPRRALKDGMLHYEQWLNSVVSPEDINRDFFVESPFAHPSVMFRREDFLSLGGYRDMGWPEDYDLWLRFAAAGKGMAKLSETLLFWRDREDRLSRRSGVYSAENFRALKAHFLKEWRLKGVSGVQVWGSGPDGKTWAKLLIEDRVPGASVHRHRQEKSRRPRLRRTVARRRHTCRLARRHHKRSPGALRGGDKRGQRADTRLSAA